MQHYNNIGELVQSTKAAYIQCLLPITALNCDALTNPANGQVSLPGGTTVGQTATYSCNTGYNLVGSSTSTCEATGQDTAAWSEDPPICEGMLYCTP